MRYFKIMRGFGHDDFIPIDETELEKAVYAQRVGNIVATFQQGQIVGNGISAILPDIHRSMGWNYAHRLTSDDYDEANRKGVTKAYTGVIALAKDRVEYFLKQGKINLIGTGASVQGLKALEAPKN